MACSTIYCYAVAREVDNARSRDAAPPSDLHLVGSQLDVVDMLGARREVEQPFLKMEVLGAPTTGGVDRLAQARRPVESYANILPLQLGVEC